MGLAVHSEAPAPDRVLIDNDCRIFFTSDDAACPWPRGARVSAATEEPAVTCCRCGLSLRLRGARLNLDRCPRCFAFAGVSVPLQPGRASVLLGAAAEGATAPATRDPGSFGHLVVCTEQCGHATVVTLQGKLDIASEDCFEKALARAWQLGATELLIDLSELEFLDATGLKALLRARERTLESGHRLLLTKGPPNVQRMFELTGTLGLFTFHD